MSRALLTGALAIASLLATPPARADDPARRACYPDAVRLCPAEVRSLSRHRVELCLANRIDQTTPACHAMILTVRAQRQAAARPPAKPAR